MCFLLKYRYASKHYYETCTGRYLVAFWTWPTCLINKWGWMHRKTLDRSCWFNEGVNCTHRLLNENNKDPCKCVRMCNCELSVMKQWKETECWDIPTFNIALCKFRPWGTVRHCSLFHMIKHLQHVLIRYSYWNETCLECLTLTKPVSLYTLDWDPILACVHYKSSVLTPWK